LKSENRDMAFVVPDSDRSDRKKIINRLSGNPLFIVSNPCFEVWFLLHFGYSTHAFQNNDEVLRNLRKKLPGHKKSLDVSET